MSPLLRSVEEAGIQGMIRKRNPTQITAADFFEEAEVVKHQLKEAEAEEELLLLKSQLKLVLF